ncbi:alpha/beta-hydrolase [Tothia fuscella]|uniref:Alpha/beta-hydrolase n=1 Tax=Tothia fuscella TaxID=1048955 RepID=A0A9P4TWS8_9PEZI|nr:alpha/beta-hydrolase [Tothia fuscella]
MNKTVRIPHLGGIEASYKIFGAYKQYKPTLILINSFTTSSDLYEAQFNNKELTEVMNLIAIEPLGHGKTKLRAGARVESDSQNFTYWDTAIMNVQVMDALGIKKAFVLGTSQGGWITVRMALIAPDRIAGIIPLGTSMDYENERTIKLGCWDGIREVTSLVEATTSASAVDSYEPSTEYCEFLIDIGFGKDCPSSTREQWTKAIKANYQGDAGRKRIREAAINLRERDGLHGRLTNVKCPVLWLHGDKDVVYSVANAKEEIELFDNSVEKNLVVVPGGHHFLSWTHQQEVDKAVLDFVNKNSKGTGNAQAMREAVGMVDI